MLPSKSEASQADRLLSSSVAYLEVAVAAVRELLVRGNMSRSVQPDAHSLILGLVNYDELASQPNIFRGTTDHDLLDSRVFGFEVAQYDPSLILVIDPLLLVYSTYLGGTERDDGHAITVDDDGNAYTTGETASDDFPRQGSPNDPVSGTFDVFAAVFTKGSTKD